MSETCPVFRFAPSPNGPLHRGHALSALLNARISHRLGGKWLLRIEDIDIARTRDAHLQSIEEDLYWLGLAWQKPVRRQSEHMQDYAAAFRSLEADGLVYPCFCSRRDVANAIAARGDAREWPHDPDGTPLYPGTCRHLSSEEIAGRLAAGDVPQGRLNMRSAVKRFGPLAYKRFDPLTGASSETSCDPSVWGDVVLVRKDTPTSYHLSVVVDDVIQGVTHIVRGRDLEAATSIHVLLQKILKLPQPFYWHHDLILDADGQKLAKSRQSLPLREEREGGMTPDRLIAEFCRNPLFSVLLDFENEQPEGGREN